jgi:hypothetical protein
MPKDFVHAVLQGEDVQKATDFRTKIQDKKQRETPVEDEMDGCTFAPDRITSQKKIKFRHEKYSTQVEGDKCEDLYYRGLVNREEKTRQEHNRKLMEDYKPDGCSFKPKVNSKNTERQRVASYQDQKNIKG